MELYLGQKDCQTLGPEMDMPLYAETVDQALSLSDPDGDGHAGPKHIKLLLKWEMGPKEQLASYLLQIVLFWNFSVYAVRSLLE